MAIQANELRIGNWVRWDKYDRDGIVNAIFYYQNKKMVNVANDSLKCSFSAELKLSEIEPIPLTEDILRTAGFTNQKLDEWSVFAYKETPICAYWDGVEWVFKYGFDSDLCFASCQFLHQFQNLIFALTGEELQISF